MTAEIQNSKGVLIVEIKSGCSADVVLPSGRRVKINSLPVRKGFIDSDGIRYNPKDKLWLKGDNFVLAK